MFILKRYVQFNDSSLMYNSGPSGKVPMLALRATVLHLFQMPQLASGPQIMLQIISN